MPRKIFIDTSGWYALIDRRDARHAETSLLVERLIPRGTRFVSTDYVVGEACTLAKARGGARMALRLLDVVTQTVALDLEWIGPERFDRAKVQFRKYHDQRFSFTDCTSFVVMRELRITDAITTDERFRMAGFQLLPERVVAE